MALATLVMDWVRSWRAACCCLLSFHMALALCTNRPREQTSRPAPALPQRTARPGPRTQALSAHRPCLARLWRTATHSRTPPAQSRAAARARARTPLRRQSPACLAAPGTRASARRSWSRCSPAAPRRAAPKGSVAFVWLVAGCCWQWRRGRQRHGLLPGPYVQTVSTTV